MWKFWKGRKMEKWGEITQQCLISRKGKGVWEEAKEERIGVGRFGPPCAYPPSAPPPPQKKKKFKYDLRFVIFSFAVDLVFNSRWWQFANHVYHGHNHSRKKQTLAARRIQLILRIPGGEHLLMLCAEVYEYEEVFQTQYLFRQSGVFIFHS